MGGLKKIDTFARKGERRQMAFVTNDAFRLALKLAIMDYSLSATEIHYWLQQVEKYSGGHLPPLTH
ncbi:hypothetical protein D3C87_2061400 [compost metagenome]